MRTPLYTVEPLYSNPPEMSAIPISDNLISLPHTDLPAIIE